MRTGWPLICALALALTAPVQAGTGKTLPYLDIVQPAAWSLHSSESVAVYASIECDAVDNWILVDNSSAGELLASGVGPVDSSQPIFWGSLPLGLRQLSLELYADGSIYTRRVSLAVADPQTPGWPWQPDVDNKQTPLVLQPEFVQNGLVLPLRTLDENQEALDRLYSFHSDGSPQEGFPLDLSALGESLEPCSLPLALPDGDGETLLLQYKGGLILHDEAERLQAPASGWVGTPPVYHTTASGLRVYALTCPAGDLLLREYDSELALMRTCTLPDGEAISGQPLVLADLNQDGEPELVLALNDPQNQTCTIYQVELSTFNVSPRFTLSSIQAKWLLAGECNNDWATDLVVVGHTSVSVVNSEGESLAHCSGMFRTSPASLIDGANGHAQRVLFTENNLAGDCFLRVLRCDGVEDPLDGLLLGHQMVCHHGPLYADVDGDGRQELLLALEDRSLVDGYGRVAVVDEQSGLQDWRWFTPGRLLNAPLLCDLDGDRRLELVVVDNRGTIAVWPTQSVSSNPPHVLGDARHAGSWLQPLDTQVPLPTVLEGRWAWSGSRAMEEGGLCRNFSLGAGELTLQGNHRLAGRIQLGADAALSVYDTADLAYPENLPIEVAGTFKLMGSGYQLGQLPQATTELASFLNSLELSFLPGSSLRSQDCLLIGLERDIVLEQANMDILRTWLEGECRIQLTGTQAMIQHSMLQLTRDMIRVDDGARLQIESSVLTSGQGVAVSTRGSALRLSECTLLTSDCAVELGGDGSVELCGCHFQGNDTDIRVLDHAEQLSVQNCDFIEAFDVAVDNRDPNAAVLAPECYWLCEHPSSGIVVREQALDDPYSTLIVPNPVTDVGTGPMVDGDEPLEWEPVYMSVSGIPLRVRYRVYRSSDAWDVIRPENLLAEVSSPWYTDHDRPVRAFYQVTAVIGYVSDDAQGQGD